MEKPQEIPVEEVAKLVNDQELKKRLPDERTRERFAKAYLETLQDIQKHEPLVRAIAKHIEDHKVITNEELLSFVISHGNAFSESDRQKIMNSTPGTMAECEILALQNSLGLPLGHGELPGHEKVIIKKMADSGTPRKRPKTDTSSTGEDENDGPLVRGSKKILDWMTAPPPKTGEETP